MSNALVTIIMTALLLAGISVLAQGSFAAVDDVSESWKAMEARTAEAARTDLAIVGVSYATPTLDVMLANTGGETLRDFEMWDVFVRYYETDGTLHDTYLDHTMASPPDDNEWQRYGIYLDASAGTPESFQPGLLDPSEELVVRLRLSPDADSGANNVVVIGTPNGVTISQPF
jgi:hypothetical protein